MTTRVRERERVVPLSEEEGFHGNSLHQMVLPPPAQLGPLRKATAIVEEANAPPSKEEVLCVEALPLICSQITQRKSSFLTGGATQKEETLGAIS